MRKIFLLLTIILFINCSSDNGTPPTLPASCGNPTNVTVTNIELTEATVNWDAVSGAVSYEIEYGVAEFVHGTGTIVTSSNTNYLLDNLDAFKRYDVYVKTICSSLESNWVGPIPFTTQCNGDNGMFVGDVTLTTQQEVDDFGAQCYSGITGSLFIGNTFNNIFSLIPLINIKSIGNQLDIVGTDLTSVYGISLNTNSSINDVNIRSNNSLINLKEIQLPAQMNGLSIGNNDMLMTLEGLEEITSINMIFSLYHNDSLESLNGLSNLEYWKYSSFKGNQNLENFTGLNSLLSIEDLWIQETYFKNLIGLESLTHIGFEILIHDNTLLESLNGLNNVSFLGQNSKIGLTQYGVSSGPNPLLTDFCALQNLLTNGTYCGLTISNNAYNPTVTDIIAGNCAQ